MSKGLTYNNYNFKAKKTFKIPKEFSQPQNNLTTRDFFQEQNYSPNFINIIPDNIDVELLLGLLILGIVLLLKGDIFKSNEDNANIFSSKNILEVIKKISSNFNIESIMGIINKFVNKGGISTMSDENINSSALLNKVKKAIEIANELKNDPNIQEIIKNSKEDIDPNTAEYLANKLKETNEESENPDETIDSGNLQNLIKQGIEIANELKKDPNIQELIKKPKEKIDPNTNE